MTRAIHVRTSSPGTTRVGRHWAARHPIEWCKIGGRIGEGDHDFKGRILHCNHWMLDLHAGDATGMRTGGVIG